MTSETNEQFVERIESHWMIAAPEADINRLFTLARRGAAVQWRPISEAPNSVVWVTDGGTCFTAFQNDGMWFAGWNFDDYSQTRIRVHPTHWMDLIPLPPPPSGGPSDE